MFGAHCTPLRMVAGFLEVLGWRISSPCGAWDPIPSTLRDTPLRSWDDARINTARPSFGLGVQPQSFYDSGGATKSITCLSFRR
jgi:hypothetical protein